MIESTTTLAKLQPLLHYLYQYPHAGGLIAFFTAFLESLAVVGSIVPGSLTMTAIGMLIGTGVLPTVSTLTWAVSGAMLGDYLSYWIGMRYQNRLRNLWPIKKYPHWLEAGEKFLHHHGCKSIIIGRFFGPMRSMVPMIAGMLKMKQMHFVLAMIPSAILWAIVYLSPGFLLGALSIQLPATLATEFLLVALFVSALIWLIAWLIERSFHTIARAVDHYFYRTWQWLGSHPKLNAINRWLMPVDRPKAYNQLARLFFLMLMLGLFLLILWDVNRHGVITLPNKALYYLMQSIQTKGGTQLILFITCIGDKYVLALSVAAISLWLFLKNHKRAALYCLLLFALSITVAYGLKLLIHFPRPGGFGNHSFPSGHTTLFVSTVGFLSVLINRSLEIYQRHTMYYIASTLTVALMLSRLYLGVHWLSDVLGGLVLGLVCTLLMVLLYRRKDTARIPATQLIIVASSVLLLCSSVYTTLRFKSLYHYYQPTLPLHVITMNQWWQYRDVFLPHYRLNRFGNPAQTFNVQWVDGLAHIEKILMKQGWQSKTFEPNFKGLLMRISQSRENKELPLVPHKYKNQTPALIMVKTLKGPRSQRKWILRLWHSGTVIKQTQSPIWIGTVNESIPLLHHHGGPKQNSNERSDDSTPIDPIKQLKQDLKPPLSTKSVTIPKTEQITPSKPYWNEGEKDSYFGKVILLIKGR